MGLKRSFVISAQLRAFLFSLDWIVWFCCAFGATNCEHLRIFEMDPRELCIQGITNGLNARINEPGAG